MQPEGRLQLVLGDLGTNGQTELPTSFQEKQLKWFLRKYVDALIQNIDERFKESSPVLHSLRIFDVLSVPAKTDDGFRY